MGRPEFDLIARHFTRPAPAAVLGVGDDCALVRVSADHDLAVSTDTLVEGVHFLPDVDPERLGYKALAVNLSDLAAMGAAPRWFTLALTMPSIDDDWLSAFSRGLFVLADSAGIELIGGDTTRGPLSITLTVMGEVPHGLALRRDAAVAGDEIWVSGMLGDAALGLAVRQQRLVVPDAIGADCISRLELPSPRLKLGLLLRGIAHACVDLSDGLLADLGHICDRSGLAANIRVEDVPLSPALLSLEDIAQRREFSLAGGDDYELCFTAPRSEHANIRNLSVDAGVMLSCIGVMQPGTGVQVVDASGQSIELPCPGFDHFAGNPHG